MESAAVIMLVAFGLPVLLVLASVWRGYVLSVLWAWFAVPVFHLPAISIPQAIGVSLIVSLLTYHKSGNEAQSEKSNGEKFVNSMSITFLVPLLGLFMGWVVTKFL